MQGQRGAPTALGVAVVLAVSMSLVLAELPVALALGAGLALAVLVIAVASNELALYLLTVSMLLSPEFIVGGIGGGTTLGRGLTLRFDDVLIALVGLTWFAKTALYKELGLVFATPLNRPIAAYSCAAVIATGLGVLAGNVSALGGSLFVLKYIEYFVIYFMVVNNLRERRQFERFLVVLLLTAAIVSVVGILQIPSGQRVSAPFEGDTPEPNTFGGYLVLMLALTAGLYLTSPSARRRLLLAGLGALMVLPLLFTLSRASYLAVIPVALALFAYGERKLFLTVVFAAAVLAAPLVAPKAVVDRILYTVSQPVQRGQVRVGGLHLDTSTSDRLGSWRQTVFEDWPKRPLFGYGVTGYRFLDAQYPRVLAETGLVGLVAFLWLQVSLFRRTRAILRASRDPLFRGVALGLLAGFAGLVAHSIGANTFIIIRVMEPFWLLTGMVMMIPQLEASQATREPVAAPTRVRAFQPARG